MSQMAPAFFALLCVVSASTESPFCPTLHADFLRRQQAAPFNASAPYDESDGKKHTPYLAISGTRATVTVGDGSPYHPMVPSKDPGTVHFVTHIYIVNQDGAIVGMDALDPTMGVPATASFDIPKGTTKLQAYEWCNLHGLWEGPEVSVSSAVTSDPACSKDDLAEAAHDSYHADLSRRQALAPWEENEPYTEDDGKKHTPYIEVDRGTATVTVGDGNPFHPMTASSDPTTVHFVTHIYVVDQNDNIVVMQNLDPQGVDKATISFSVPEGVTNLTAYEFCNLHGLWKGPTVQITSGDVSAGFGSRVVMSLVIVVAGALGF